MPSVDKYTRSAKNQPCQIRVPGVCNADSSTTVFCHLNGAGLAIKHFNIHGAYGCSDCHDAVDGRGAREFSSDDLLLMHFEGMLRTQILMIEQGVLKL